MLSNLKCTRRCLRVTRSVHSVHKGPAQKTHYEVLKVPKTASADQIRKAYIKQCKEVHPDRNRLTPESNTNFVRLNEAYTVLSDLSAKREYDRKLNMGINITESYYPSSPQRPPGPKPDDRIYKVYQQTYYGATQEERAQRERDFHERRQRDEEKAEMGWARDTQNNKLRFNILVGAFVVTIYLIVNYILKHSTNKTMRERALKARDAMEGRAKYPKAKRKYLRTDFELKMEAMERRENR